MIYVTNLFTSITLFYSEKNSDKGTHPPKIRGGGKYLLTPHVLYASAYRPPLKTVVRTLCMRTVSRSANDPISRQPNHLVHRTAAPFSTATATWPTIAPCWQRSHQPRAKLRLTRRHENATQLITSPGYGDRSH